MGHKTKLLSLSPYLAKNFTYEKYGNKVPVDEKIASLIFYAWKLGINTTSSCQNIRHPWIIRRNVRTVWINFADILSAKKFINFTSSLNQNGWFFAGSPSSMEIPISLYFPLKYIKPIEKILKNHGKKK